MGGGGLPSPLILQEMKMVEVLSEIKIGPRIIEPVVKILKKKPEMLEEQIRDSVPCDVEPEEEENEKL